MMILNIKNILRIKRVPREETQNIISSRAIEKSNRSQTNNNILAHYFMDTDEAIEFLKNCHCDGLSRKVICNNIRKLNNSETERRIINEIESRLNIRLGDWYA